jgi:hypothetical protein
LAGVNEIAIFVARADDTDAAVELGTAAVDEILSRLLPAHRPGRTEAG